MRKVLLLLFCLLSTQVQAQTTPAGIKNGGRVTTWSALSTAQKSFLISRYTSVTLGSGAVSALSEIKAGNPSMFVSLYTNAIAATIGTSIYTAANGTESLFAHDSESNRIDSTVFSSQLMNPQAAGWQTINSDYAAANPGFDCLFIDTANPTLYAPHWEALPAGYTDAGWKSNVLSFFAAMDAATSWLVVYNGLHEGYATGGYHDHVQGGVVENFAFGPSTQTVNWTRIGGHITDIVQSGIDGLIGCANPAIDPDDEAQRRIALAAYLLAQHSASSLIFVDVNDLLSSPQWWPEYELDIGTPITEHQSLSAMLHVSGIYVRQYTGGVVLINPTASQINYDVGRSSYATVFSGGGVVGVDGATNAILSYLPQASTVSVPANDALILRYDIERHQGCVIADSRRMTMQ